MTAFTILDAMDHEDLWKLWFRDPETWRPWRSFLATLFGLPVSAEGEELFRQCTGRSEVRLGGYNEAWLICGRRAGKSFVLSLIASYLAIFRDWTPYLVPGEMGLVKVIATDRRQARVIHRYCRALITQVPAFEEYIVRESDDIIELNNSIAIEVQTASFRSTRGFTVVAALLDEIAYFRSDDQSANPDHEVLNALRPAMATVPGAFLLAASSPYSRRGELWNAHRRWYGNNDARQLVWKASTRTMNPTVPAELIDEALEEDAAKAGAEWLAEFRTDIETFVNRDVVDAAIIPGRFELPYEAGVQYYAFCDPSGAAVDSMSLALAYRPKWNDNAVRLAVVREVKPPFSPERVVDDFTDLLKAYRVHEIHSDRWGGAWVEEAFKNKGIKQTTSERTKSQIYLEFLPLLNSGKLELLDNQRMVSQLCSLERKTGRGSGRDVVDHPPGGHDDLVNAAAGACVLAGERNEMLIWARMGREW